MGGESKMSLKKYYYDKGEELCYTCEFIDEYIFNVNEDGEVPHGWDGTAFCCKYNKSEEKSIDNRDYISPCWKACIKYKRCTERQAKYIDIYDFKTQSIIKNPNDISKIK